MTIDLFKKDDLKKINLINIENYFHISEVEFHSAKELDDSWYHTVSFILPDRLKAIAENLYFIIQNEPPFYSLTFLEILSPCDKHIEGYSLHNHDLFDLIASLTYDQLHTLVGAFDYIFEYIPVYHKYKTDESTMLFRRFWDKQLSRYQIIDKNPFLHPNFT